MRIDLIAAATSLRRRIIDADPGLLIELPTGESEIEQLIEQLSIYIVAENRDISDVAPILALVAVHIAAHADDSHSAYRNLFYTRLKYSGNGDAVWQNMHGPAIRSFLEVTFPEVDLPESRRPFAYVGSVYRHCGVPPSARRSFAELLAGLVLRQGWHFSRSDLRTVSSGLLSPVLHDFLTIGDAGFHFSRTICQMTAEALENAEAGTRVPEYRRTLVSAVLESIRSRRSAIPVYWPEPVIRFDPHRRRVEVWLDPKALANKAYSDQQGRVVRHLVFDVAECPDVINVAGTAWRIDQHWARKQGMPASFRRTSGALDERPNPARTDWFVLSRGARPTGLDDWIETETLAFSDEPNTAWSVLSYPGAGTDVIAGSRPKLKWSRNSAVVALPEDCFIGKLPPVRVEGIEAPNDAFAIQLCTPSGIRTIALKSGPIEIEDVPVGAGYLRLLRKDTAFDDSPLRFTMLPRGFHAAVLEFAVGKTDPFHIHCLTPSGWSITFSAPHDLVRDGLYRFSGGEWTVELTLNNGRSTVSLDFLVPRVSGQNRASEAGKPDDEVVWEDEMDTVLLSASTEGDVLLRTSTGFRCLCSVSAERGTCTLDFDKAIALELLEEQPIAAMIFKTRDRIVETGLHFASSDYIGGALTGGHWDLRAVRGPAKFTEWLAQAAAMANGTPETSQGLCLPRNLALRELTCELQLGSAVFDGGSAPPDSGCDVRADSALVRAVDWYQRAKEALLRELDPSNELVDSWPQHDIESLDIARWRDLLIKIRESLVNLPANTRDQLNRIREAVNENPYLMLDLDLATEPGGTEFLKASQAYNRAGKSTRPRRIPLLVSAKTHVEESLADLSDGDRLLPVALLLKALILLRSGNRHAADEVINRAPKPELLKGAFKTLERACESGILYVEEQHIGNEVNLSDLFDAWPTDEPSDRGNDGSSI